MVATVIINESNGGTDGTPGATTRVDGQGANAGTDVRFATTDAYNPVATYPCVVPSSGDNYSYWKHISLGISGTFTTVNNINFYTDGTIGWTCGTGGGLYVGTRDAGDNGAVMPTNYEIATGTQGTTGNSMATDHAWYTTGGSVALASTYTSGSTLLIDSADYSAADESDATVLQCKIHDDATQGLQSDETLYWTYDEI